LAILAYRMVDVCVSNWQVAMSDVVERWGEAVGGRGFAQIPNYLMLLNTFLDEKHRLSPVELLLLIQLVGTWWRRGGMPFPSMATLADRCGVSVRQIQRSITQLEKLRLIMRVTRARKGLRASNAYDLSPLVVRLNEVAKAFPNEYPRRTHTSPSVQLTARPDPFTASGDDTSFLLAEGEVTGDQTAAPATGQTTGRRRRTLSDDATDTQPSTPTAETVIRRRRRAPIPTA
jgi:hypothetical protein